MLLRLRHAGFTFMVACVRATWGIWQELLRNHGQLQTYVCQLVYLDLLKTYNGISDCLNQIRLLRNSD